METNTRTFRVDRSVITVTDLKHNDENQYWWSRTPLERLEAIEINRQAVYGYRDNPPRFQRLLEITGR